LTGDTLLVQQNFKKNSKPKNWLKNKFHDLFGAILAKLVIFDPFWKNSR
jgi:hypothetical protein